MKEQTKISLYKLTTDISELSRRIIVPLQVRTTPGLDILGNYLADGYIFFYLLETQNDVEMAVMSAVEEIKTRRNKDL